MSLDKVNRTTMVALEVKKSKETYEEAIALANINRLSGAASRLYYAVFHAVSALLIFDSHPVRSHKGAFVAFCQYYINTGKLPREMGRLFSQLETLRENSDYNCVYVVTKAELEDQLAPAKEMIDTIAEMVKEK